ncbi:MAG: ABC transporter substrate-binding protein [Deltaproteobacteria bacterium]|nr:ABC transporter substrate-binding protein [Deltaproteobacteria bacterium]
MKQWVWILFAVVLLSPLTGPGPADAGPPIRIAYLQSDIHQLACWVALDQGYYQAAGLDVEVAGIFKAGPEEMSAFAAGELDMGYVGEAPATTAVANGVARVTVLAQVNTEGSAIMVRKDAPVKTLKDLVNKRIAIPGHSTVQDFLLRKALTKFKVPQSQVQITVLKPPEMIGALSGRQINAFIAWEPYPAKAQIAGIGKVLLTSAQIWRNHPCCVLVADNRFLKERPQEARSLVKAHVRATDYIDTHPEDAVRIGVKYTGMDTETVRLAIKNVNYTYQLSVEGETEYVNFLTRLKYIRVPDVTAFVDRFIDQAILAEILSP